MSLLTVGGREVSALARGIAAGLPKPFELPDSFRWRCDGVCAESRITDAYHCLRCVPGFDIQELPRAAAAAYIAEAFSQGIPAMCYRLGQEVGSSEPASHSFRFDGEERVIATLAGTVGAEALLRRLESKVVSAQLKHDAAKNAHLHSLSGEYDPLADEDTPERRAYYAAAEALETAKQKRDALAYDLALANKRSPRL